MPTGYTYKIEEIPEYTTKQYVEHCAHNFGLLMHLRDEQSSSLPDSVPCNHHYYNNLMKSKVALDTFLKLSKNNLRYNYLSWIEDTTKNNVEKQKGLDEIDSRYNAILTELNSWHPKSDIGGKIKAFAISQINESRRYSEPFLTTILTYEQWYQSTLERLSLDVEYYTKEAKKEQDRNYKFNLALQELKQDLKSL